MGSAQSNDIGSIGGNSEAFDVDLYAQVENLPKLLKQRQRQLDAREKELERALKALEREKKMLIGAADPGDIIHLNVGGTYIAVLRQTITSIPGSMLASRFSGRFDSTMVKDAQGRFFIEHPIELFAPLVNFLRAKRCQTARAAPVLPPIFDEKRKQDDFNRMVEYFGMTLGMYPVQIDTIVGNPDTVTVSDDRMVAAKEWATIDIKQQGHKRVINSFEVTIIDAERIQIGWANPKNTELGNNGSGVGDVSNTISLDFIRGGIIIGGEFLEINGLELKGTRTVVRSEEFGSTWFVDDLLVASLDPKEEDEMAVKIPSSYNTKNKKPTISVKGQIQITDIAYQI